MRILYLMITILCATVSCNKAKVTPSGNIISQSYNFNDIDRLYISGGLSIEYMDTTWENVLVYADDNVMPLLEIKKNSNNLYTQFQGVTLFSHDPNVKIYVYGPRVSDIIASGGSQIQIIKKPERDYFHFEGSGGSQLSGHMDCADLDINISGGTTVDINGYSASLKINASGGSTFEGFDHVTYVLKAEMSGGSTMKVTAEKEIYVNASGGSTVHYKGNAIIRESNLSGGSQLIHL